jgi:hypothetical protein
MSIVKTAINKVTFGPTKPGDILPKNPITERTKPVINKVKKEANKTILNWGMKS